MIHSDATSALIFEGSEKKLEVVFTKKPAQSLRSESKAFWSKLVDASGAQILSECSNHKVTAYLLSESSLFVFDDRIVMITCGRTSLINAMEMLVEHFGVDAIESVFFERKNEAFPEAQVTRFEDDAELLKKWFPLGQTQHVEYEALGGYIQLFHWGHAAPTPEQARTFELLMHGIDPRINQILQKPSHVEKQNWSRVFRFESLFPSFVIDEHWFEPCGFSLNGISGNEYFTIHITPESEASYVSLETNRGFRDTHEFKEAIQTVLNVFKPKSSLIAQFCHASRTVFDLEWSYPSYHLSQTQSMTLEPGVCFGFNAIGRVGPTFPQNQERQWMMR